LSITEKETLHLLQRMAADDQAATRQFYLAYARIVRNHLRRGGWESSVVEDAVQTTMLEIWRHPDRYQPGGLASFKTWLLKIADRRLIDLLRRRPEQAEELDEGMISTEVDEGYEQMLQAERKAALQQCRQKLKGIQRQLLALAYEHELSGREIGEIMGMPEGTVKSALHYAKGLIRKCLERLLKGVTK
jgi:RNA polymerase sigma-70 factor, ECF subfamily